MIKWLFKPIFNPFELLVVIFLAEWVVPVLGIWVIPVIVFFVVLSNKIQELSWRVIENGKTKHT